MALLTRGPRDIPALDQWFVLDESVRPEGRSITQLGEREPAAVVPELFVHWSLLSDSEREKIYASVGL